MADEPLDALPLDVLLALTEALADPSARGRKRAEARAADAGVSLVCTGAPPDEPIPMQEAPEGIEAVVLTFGPPQR